MSIQAPDVIEVHTGAGAALNGAIPGQFHSEAQVRVYKLSYVDGVTEQLLVAGTDYTITKAAVAGSSPAVYTGSITTVASIAATEKIAVMVWPASEQPVDFSAVPYDPTLHERELDLAAKRDAAFFELIKRSPRMGLAYTGDQPTIPDPVEGRALVWGQGAKLLNAPMQSGDIAADVAAAQAARSGAETAETGAETARDKAEDWAEEVEDTEVEAGQYSAKHHSAKASAQRVLSETARTGAEAAQTAAELARDSGWVLNNVFANTTDGIAGTSDGDYFSVPSGASDESLILYQNQTGTAVQIKTYPSVASVENVVEQVNLSRWIVGKPLTFAASLSGTTYTISWATLRLLDGVAGVRGVADLASRTFVNNDCVYVDATEVYSGAYTLQSGAFNSLYSSFVDGTNILLFANYFGIPMGALAEFVLSQIAQDAAEAAAQQADVDAAMLNSRRARRWTSGNAITTLSNGGGTKVKTTRGYHYWENNSGAFKYKIAAVAETSLAAGYGLVVDLDGTPNGSGELVPTYVAIASGAQTGWEAGERLILIARDHDGQIFGEYQVNSNVGTFDGEAAFLLNNGDPLPSWDSATRTLTWPDLLIHRHVGTGVDGQGRIKLQAGSIVVPSGGFQTVVLDLAQLNDTLTPNTAVSVGQYIDATPGWNGTEGAVLPLFAVGHGDLAYPLRFPPTQGSVNFPTAIADQSAYDQSEIVVIADGSGQVDIYMKGSRRTSNKYLKYPMTNTVVPSIGADVWRWDEVYEAERTGDFAFTQGLQICNPGENETAIRQTGKSDFMGGNAHGDEEKVWVRMLIDGSEVDLAAAANYRCRRVEFMQHSELFEADTATPQSNKVADAYKRWVFEGGELEITQHIVWDDAISLQDTYMAMLTLLRTSGATQVSDKGYREPLWAEEDISVSGFTAVFSTASIAKASGPNGYSAEVEILEGWDKANREFNFSPSASYNKFYFDFTGPGYTTTIGEVFKSRVRYKLDTKN